MTDRYLETISLLLQVRWRSDRESPQLPRRGLGQGPVEKIFHDYLQYRHKSGNPGKRHIKEVVLAGKNEQGISKQGQWAEGASQFCREGCHQRYTWENKGYVQETLP